MLDSFELDYFHIDANHNCKNLHADDWDGSLYRTLLERASQNVLYQTGPKIRVWDYDCGEHMDELVAYTPERLVALKARWDDPYHLSGAELVCPALEKAHYDARITFPAVTFRTGVFDEDIPF